MKVRLSVVKGRGFRWHSRTGQAIYPPIVGKPFGCYLYAEQRRARCHS